MARPGDDPALAATIGIVGTGLLGASIGLRARALGWRVIGYDADAAAAMRAEACRAIDRVAPLERVLGCTTVVLAIPLDATCAVLRDLARRPAAPSRSLLLDVASLKSPVLAAAAGLPGFVATHPIAGSERSGPEAGSPGLFTDRTWTYVPSGDAELDGRLLAFLVSMGARPLALDAGEHDRIVGMTSHLPQVLAVALAEHVGRRMNEAGVAPLCGSGLASMTRLGESSWPMWRSILRENAPVVAQEVRTLAGILTQIADELVAGDSDLLGARFAASAAAVGRARIGAERPVPGAPPDMRSPS